MHCYTYRCSLTYAASRFGAITTYIYGTFCAWRKLDVSIRRSLRFEYKLFPANADVWHPFACINSHLEYSTKFLESSLFEVRDRFNRDILENLQRHRYRKIKKYGHRVRHAELYASSTCQLYLGRNVLLTSHQSKNSRKQVTNTRARSSMLTRAKSSLEAQVYRGVFQYQYIENLRN